MYCEMVKMEPLVRRQAQTFRLLDYEASMHPIGAQICGSNVKIAGECAKIIEDLDSMWSILTAAALLTK